MLDQNYRGWPGWETVRVIGHGSFGTVYEIERDVFGQKEKAALKVITVPQNDSEINELRSNGFDDESITDTFKSYLKNIVDEYSLMRKMNGNTNVVNCDDVRYVQHDDGYGWDIYIKMELLMSLTTVSKIGMTEEQVIQIGKDICKALILCKKHNIVHRDIKPANIFVSENGDYKLGDFGIAKTVEETTGGTKIGTYEYMAPEVYHDEPYGSSVDIYSLGLVLYWLLNERRTPFLPLPPKCFSYNEKESAYKRRFRGEPIPVPAHGSKELQQIVLKACAYRSEDRFPDADAFLSALNNVHSAPVKSIKEETEKTAPSAVEFDETGAENETVSAFRSEKAEEKPDRARDSLPETNDLNEDDDGSKTVSIFDETETGKKQEEGASSNPPQPEQHDQSSRKKKRTLIVAAVLIACVVVLGLAGNHRYSPESLYAKGESFFNAQDYAFAMEWYQKSAAAGSSDAMNDIGYLYYNGLGVTQDYSKAMEWYTKAADAGNASAMHSIGYLYYSGLGVMQDYNKAMEWCVKAADAGNASAMNGIGNLYYNGLGVTQDYAKAMEWYTKAADAGNASAMNSIGILYVDGLGVTQDYSKAMEWYMKAADAGYDWAMYNIGELYYNGLGVTRRYSKAMEWYTKAAEAGNALAMTSIGNLYYSGLGITHDYKKAMEWYTKAADAGDASAMHNIGWLYEIGYGVPQDSTKAKEWYDKAKAAGYRG